MAKCTLCVDRTTVGLEPACVKACPTGCLHFGTKDGHGRVGQRAGQQLKANGFANAGLYNPPGVGGTNVITVLKFATDRRSTAFPADPTVPASVALPKARCGARSGGDGRGGGGPGGPLPAVRSPAASQGTHASSRQPDPAVPRKGREPWPNPCTQPPPTPQATRQSWWPRHEDNLVVGERWCASALHPGHPLGGDADLLRQPPHRPSHLDAHLRLAGPALRRPSRVPVASPVDRRSLLRLGPACSFCTGRGEMRMTDPTSAS